MHVYKGFIGSIHCQNEKEQLGIADPAVCFCAVFVCAGVYVWCVEYALTMQVYVHTTDKQIFSVLSFRFPLYFIHTHFTDVDIFLYDLLERCTHVLQS